ncbi:MAG: DUF1501 domain-containing protein [Rhodospirillaceae bacterium]|nr:DUF1501 domain-containing protein [Rhodospirillaceae bacterium]
MKRRDFLKYSLLLPSLAGSGIELLTYPSFAATGNWAGNWDRTLVLLEFKGGNDGLNTVVPFTDKKYYEIRPNLAIPPDKVLKISDKLGFNQAFEPLMPLWDSKEMAVVLGVGYPQPNQSHFRGINIWNSASDAKTVIEQGWISRLFEEQDPGQEFAADGINLGRNSMGVLGGNKNKVVTLARKPDKILRQAGRIQLSDAEMNEGALGHILKQRRDLRSAADTIIAQQIGQVELTGFFSGSRLGGQFETAARLLIAGVKVPVLKLMITKFDTHAGQEPLHAELLVDVATNVAAFAKIMKSKNLWDKVAVMSYSEFGRRPFENNSSGTDHGTAAPHFLFGGKVKGGFYGEQSPLDDLENENLKYRVHFREMYASVTREWWGLKAGFIKEKQLGLFA